MYEKDAAIESLDDAKILKILNSGQIDASGLRLLLKAEEELSQTQNFIRIFPSVTTDRLV